MSLIPPPPKPPPPMPRSGVNPTRPVSRPVPPRQTPQTSISKFADHLRMCVPASPYSRSIYFYFGDDRDELVQRLSHRGIHAEPLFYLSAIAYLNQAEYNSIIGGVEDRPQSLVRSDRRNEFSIAELNAKVGDRLLAVYATMMGGEQDIVVNESFRVRDIDVERQAVELTNKPIGTPQIVVERRSPEPQPTKRKRPQPTCEFGDNCDVCMMHCYGIFGWKRKKE